MAQEQVLVKTQPCCARRAVLALTPFRNRKLMNRSPLRRTESSTFPTFPLPRTLQESSTEPSNITFTVCGCNSHIALQTQNDNAPSAIRSCDCCFSFCSLSPQHPRATHWCPGIKLYSICLWFCDTQLAQGYPVQKEELRCQLCFIPPQQ